MRPEIAPPSWGCRFRWQDVGATVGILVAASLLIFPAIQYSRYQSRVITCQNHLRQLGSALKQYSSLHDQYFPRIPTEGKASVAGVYAPILVRDGLLTDVKWVLCPGSELARHQTFRIPMPDELQAVSPEELARLRRWMGGSYGYSLGYVREGQYRGTRDLNRTYFVIMADAPSSLPGFQSLNHGGYGQNVLFEDGHVEFLTSSKPYADADDFYANDDGLMRAGIRRDDAVVGASACPPIVYVGNN